MHQPARAMPLRQVGELVELLPGVPAAALRADCVHRAIRCQGIGKDAKVDVTQDLGEIHELHSEAKVWLV